MSLISKVLKRAKEHGYNTKWYTGIGAASAKALVREWHGESARPPRIGYEMLSPETTHNGHRGVWALKNTAGRYELQFYYR